MRNFALLAMGILLWPSVHKDPSYDTTANPLQQSSLDIIADSAFFRNYAQPALEGFTIGLVMGLTDTGTASSYARLARGALISGGCTAAMTSQESTPSRFGKFAIAAGAGTGGILVGGSINRPPIMQGR